MAATADIEKQLGWEARQRPRAGIAAGIGAVGLVAFLLLQQAIGNGVPTASFRTLDDYIAALADFVAVARELDG